MRKTFLIFAVRWKKLVFFFPYTNPVLHLSENSYIYNISSRRIGVKGSNPGWYGEVWKCLLNENHTWHFDTYYAGFRFASFFSFLVLFSLRFETHSAHISCRYSTYPTSYSSLRCEMLLYYVLVLYLFIIFFASRKVYIKIKL